MQPASFILYLVVFFGTVALLATWVKVRILKAAKRRLGLTKGQFIEALAGKGIPEDIAQAVFDGFHKWAARISEDFPLTPDVSVRDFAPWVEYEEEDIIHEVLTQTGRHWPAKQLLPCSPGWTLADVAKFVADCPRSV